MNEKFDKNGNCIYEEKSNGNEHSYKYDENKNIVYSKISIKGKDVELWLEYNENYNLIHEKFSTGEDVRYSYDKKNRLTHYVDEKGFQTWHKYQDNDNTILTFVRDHNGDETYHKCDDELTETTEITKLEYDSA